MSEETRAGAEPSGPRHHGWPVRVVRWTLFSVVGLVVLVAGVVIGGVLWLRTPWGNEFVRGQIHQRLGDLVNGEVRLERVEGDVLTGITLYGFALIGEDGVALIDAERIRLQYVLRPFFERRIAVALVELERPQIHLVRYDDGRWNFNTLFKPRPPPPPGAPPGWGSYVQIDRLEFIDGSVDVGFETGGWAGFDWSENRFVDLNGELRLGLYSRERTQRRFTANDLSLRATAPELMVRRLDGTGIWTPDSVAFHEIAFETAGSEIRTDGLLTLGEHDSLALEVDAPRIDLTEVRRFFPAIRLDGVASLEGKLEGPAASPDLAIDAAHVETAEGSVVTTSGTLLNLSDLSFDLDVRVAPLAPADARAFVDAYPFVVPLRGDIRVSGPLRRMSIDADLESPAGGMAADGSVSIGAGPLGYDLVATSRDLHIGVLLGRPDLDIELSGAYRIDGRGGGRDARATFAGELERSRIYRWDIVALETRGNLEGGAYHADTVVARTPQSVILAEGTFGLAGDGVIQSNVVVESEDLEEVWPGLGGFGGRARATARLDGTYRGFDVDAQIMAGDLAVSGVVADSFAGSLRLEQVGGPLRMEAEGTLHALEAAGVRADTAAVRLRHAAGRMEIEAFLDHGAETTTDLAATVDFSAPVNTVSLQELRHKTPEARWEMTQGTLTYAAARLQADQVVITENGQRLSLDGVLALDESSSDLVVSADVDLSAVARLAGRPPDDFGGRATVEGRLRGPRRSPAIEISGEVLDGSVMAFRFVRLRGDIEYADRQAEIDLTVTTPAEGHDIVATGTLPLDLSLVAGVNRLPNRPIDLQIRGRNTDLTLLAAFLPGLENVSGPIDLQVDVSGTTESPRFEGVAELREGRFDIVATSVTYQDISGRITFNNDEIVIERIDGTDGERGRFEIDGRVAMANLRLGELNINLRATDLEVVEHSRQEVQVHADLRLTGTTTTPEITGRMVVDEAIYRLPERSRKNVIDLEEAVIYVEIPGARRRPERSASLWNRTRLDIEVEVTDDAILTASNARVEIAGDLSLFKPAGTAMPTFSGTLDVLRGYYEEFGKRFTIEEGEVFFYGTPELNPGLHIVASQTVQGVEAVGDVDIRIIVGGTLQNPTIDLESTPPFEKSEIISIALFGSPSVSAAQQSRFDETVTGLFVGAAAAPLQDALAGELGLDAFEITQRTEATGETATLFRVGKFITPDVYVTVEQEVSGPEEHQAVSLRYQVTNQFTLQASTGTQQSGVDLFWEFAF